MVGKALSDDQNKRAREWLEDLLALHHGQQTKVAELLETSQATISRIRHGKLGTSVHLVQRIAAQLGRDPAEVLGLEAPPPPPPASAVSLINDPRFPSSHNAQQAALLMGCTVEDLKAAYAAHDTPEDPGDVYWINEFLRARDRRARRERASKAG